jgi:hypothetical protein
MKVATFGCSFAYVKSNEGYPIYNKNGKSWMQILSEDFNYDVTNFGVSASSMYYSYSTFKENYKNFDKIIFLGTYADRKYCPNMTIANGPQHIISHFTLPDVAALSGIKSEIVDLIKNYYLFVHNTQEHDDMKELMEMHIKQLAEPNVLYVDIEKTLNKLRNLEDNGKMYRPDHRFCHMSNQNNYIFASLINDWLMGKSFDFDITKFIKPTEEELKSYYEIT